jgi:hypothetical protein
MWYVPPECKLIFSVLHGIISPMTELFELNQIPLGFLFCKNYAFVAFKNCIFLTLRSYQEWLATATKRRKSERCRFKDKRNRKTIERSQ